MNVRTIKTLQQVLTADGRYAGPMNGVRDAATEAAVAAVIGARKAELTEDPGSWSPKRRAIACLQLACKDRGIPAGPADGLWGPQTDAGVEGLIVFLDTGAPPVAWRDRVPSSANPNGWPMDTEADLRAFYGPPTDAGLVAVPCPWRLAIAWDLSKSTGSIRVHPKVADSLRRVLDRVYAHYGEQRIRELRLHLYGGSYNNRPMRGGTRLSTHAWGIAIDWDPERNRLNWNHERAGFARPEYDAWWQAWEDEGWVGLGRHKNFDWMHVQAARV